MPSSASPASSGRLAARPISPNETGRPGLHPLGLSAGRDGLLYVAPGYRPYQPAPLVVLLHGASGNAQNGLAPLRDLADGAGLILLAPDSRGQTWDVLRGGFGPDVAYLELALAKTFSRYAVDPARIAIGGFSDGASYALSLGMTNGDLFGFVLAFSPGFAAPAAQVGAPRLFVSHGLRDQVLRIEHCSRRLVPRLRQTGYDVLYHEFDGSHSVPSNIARKALDWFLSSERS